MSQDLAEVFEAFKERHWGENAARPPPERAVTDPVARRAKSPKTENRKSKTENRTRTRARVKVLLLKFGLSWRFMPLTNDEKIEDCFGINLHLRSKEASNLVSGVDWEQQRPCSS